MMSIGGRLKRLEAAAKKMDQSQGMPPTRRGWLALFEAYREQGLFRAEPECHALLTEYADALKRAEANGTPPEKFLPHEDDGAKRLDLWDQFGRYAECDRLLSWLAGMLHRGSNGQPGITRQDVKDCASWLVEHRGALAGGHEVSRWCAGQGGLASLTWQLSRVCWNDGADRAVHTVRRLQELLNHPAEEARGLSVPSIF